MLVLLHNGMMLRSCSKTAALFGQSIWQRSQRN